MIGIFGIGRQGGQHQGTRDAEEDGDDEQPFQQAVHRGQEQEQADVETDLQQFVALQRRHDLVLGQAQQIIDRDELIAFLLQGLDDRRQRLDRLGADAAAVVHQDDLAGVAFVDILLAGGAVHDGRIGMNAVQHVLDHLSRAGSLPILGIDVQPDIGVAQPLADQGRHQFVVGGRLGVTEIGRPHQAHRPAGIGFDHTLGRVQLQPDLPLGDLGHVRVGIGVIAQHVALAHHLAQQVRVIDRLFTDDEEGAVDIVRRQDLENLRRPASIGTVVEGQGDGLAGRRRPPHDIGCRQGLILFALGDIVLVEGHGALAVGRRGIDVQHLPGAFDVNVTDGAQPGQIRGLGRLELAEGRPDRRIFPPQAPQGHAGNGRVVDGFELVPRAHRVQEPHLVLDAVFLV